MPEPVSTPRTPRPWRAALIAALVTLALALPVLPVRLPGGRRRRLDRLPVEAQGRSRSGRWLSEAVPWDDTAVAAIRMVD